MKLVLWVENNICVHSHQLILVRCLCAHRFTIDKLDDIQSFALSLDIEFCPDGDCTSMEILDDLIIPIPFCNPNITFSLPGDGSIAGFVEFLKDKITDESVTAVLRKLGLEVRGP